MPEIVTPAGLSMPDPGLAPDPALPRRHWRSWAFAVMAAPCLWWSGAGWAAEAPQSPAATGTPSAAAKATKVADAREEWAFQPLRPVTPPHVAGVATGHPLDRFIDAQLAAQGLHRSPAADARTLCRRLFFDLIGLPPSPAQSEAFEAAHKVDPSAAVAHLADQLLASPQYGERWARHWLDVVHYGDTHGYDKDKPRPYAWPYRDYVIRAFNSDKPYARFLEEQLAGDVLFPGESDGIEALGFIAAGPWDFIGHAELPESKTDGKVARHLDRDDMVANTMGTFASVTVHCAQCHAHKFDPISQEDYYSLQAVFAAVDRTERKYYSDPALTRRAAELETRQRQLKQRQDALDAQAVAAAGEGLRKLDAEIAAAAGQPGGNPGAEFGYHSEISTQPTVFKWVQVDLGRRVALDRVVLWPAYDDFANIGAGFGFPLRYQVQVGDDPEFRESVILSGVAVNDDAPNPGFKPQVVPASEVTGRYVRVTVIKLAPRSDDFIFALAELQVFDQAGTNHALHRPVTAQDSIEAPPRWQKANLVDGIVPAPPKTGNVAELKQRRMALWKESLSAAAQTEWTTTTNALAGVRAELAALPPARMVYAGGVHTGSGNFVGTGGVGGQPRTITVLARGQVTQPGQKVGPGALSALDFRSARFELPETATEGDRRVALARWLVDPANPLTWRSIVNRVWQYHFGRGLVATPNDFGRMGARPTHPQLLDWLAMEFRDGGGSLKQLHRLIVTSATYQQAVGNDARAENLDSDNTLLWRQNRRKLEAEAVRDAVLQVSGQLDLTPGGPGWQDFVIEHPEHSPHYEYGLSDPEDRRTWRRSIYRFIVRSQTQPWMTVLDCADPSIRVERRNESQSALQALALLNNGFMVAQARHFAERVQRERSTLEEQVRYAHRLAVGRSPRDSEYASLLAFARQHGLPQLCRVLFNLSEFSFVD